MKSLKTQNEELEAKLKSYQSKLAFETRQKQKFKKKSKIGLMASTLEGSGRKRKVQEEEAVHETTVSVHEEKKQKKCRKARKLLTLKVKRMQFFSQKASQNSHKETVDEKKKHFECECGKQFSSKKTLQRHKNSVHAEVKKVFQCEFCNLQFSRKDNLKTGGMIS